MAGSSLGTIFKLVTFGESHGKCIGGIIEGLPSNQKIDLLAIQNELNKRKPGQSDISSSRKESDKVELLSGIFNGYSTGTPIGFIIRNKDVKSGDYSHLKNTFRPSHADFTYQKKYGIRDHRGGGRSSARETACRVVAGAIAKQVLDQIGISFLTYVDQIGNLQLNKPINVTKEKIEANSCRCPDKELAAKMEELILNVKAKGDTIGGCIQGIINGVPIGLGEPIFDKLNAELGKAMLSINAVKGFEIGSGFNAATMKGSEHNDIINQDFTTKSNNSGGIQGGISNGMPICFRVAFKPVATLMQNQKSVSKDGKKQLLEGKGRHDPCVVPRAVPIVEAMAAIVILDFYLRQKSTSI